MKVRIGDVLITAAEKPVAFIFKSDEERRWLGEQLLSIPDNQKGGKVFILGPAELEMDREQLVNFAKESYQMAEHVE